MYVFVNIFVNITMCVYIYIFLYKCTFCNHLHELVVLFLPVNLCTGSLIWLCHSGSFNKILYVFVQSIMLLRMRFVIYLQFTHRWAGATNRTHTAGAWLKVASGTAAKFTRKIPLKRMARLREDARNNGKNIGTPSIWMGCAHCEKSLHFQFRLLIRSEFITRFFLLSFKSSSLAPISFGDFLI